ncbi:synaptonemal complex central element protein 1-like isoform X8 [Hemicordylus capensis]|uniref:synaptonemal complex central element protein 1-like isoform X8 n=1 Tax=Hemicordylus capensis TaxID=884348 RepID=UPI002303BCD6|nr:synaptonemal complex central element protein 1-like isoform X8 [Hemicordylus capensis]
MEEDDQGSWDLTSKMEEILSLVKQMQNVGNLEPRIDDLVSRINKLQQEARKIMQLHCEETEAEMYRKQKLSMELKQRIEELTAEIQEEKLKQRQQRLQFETLLDELTEKHKSLGELHAREKSVIGMRESKECWLSEEKLIQGKLADVQDKFDLLSQSAFSEERKFLKSQEAASALELFKEENQKAKEYLETVSKYNSDLHQKCGRLKTELEDLEGQDDFIKED